MADDSPAGGGRGPFEFEQWLADAKAKAVAGMKEAVGLGAAVNAASATARSEDGSVTVTVDSGGHLRDLRFGPNAMSTNPNWLASLIVRTTIEARRAVGEKLIDVYAPTGAGAEMTGALREMVDGLEVPSDAIPGEPAPANTFDKLVEDPPERAPEPAPQPVRPMTVHASTLGPVARPTSQRRPTRAVHDDVADFSEEGPW